MIAVVTINYRSEEKTVAFVREEIPKIKGARKVVVVNNAATEESSRTLREALPDCLVVDSGENLGFARGNNLGAETARKEIFGGQISKDDYILFVNNDIRFTSPDVVDALASKLSELEEAAVIGPRIVGLDGKFQSPEPFQPFMDRHFWLYWSTPFMSEEKHTRRFGLDYAKKAGEGYHYRVMGSIFLVKARDFFECGGMDPHTFLYCEEQILSERLKAIGKKVYYYPAVEVLHEHGTTTNKYFDKRKRREMAFESERYYYETYIGTPKWQVALARVTYWLKGISGR